MDYPGIHADHWEMEFRLNSTPNFFLFFKKFPEDIPAEPLNPCRRLFWSFYYWFREHYIQPISSGYVTMDWNENGRS
jgi:hypothetical protein